MVKNRFIKKVLSLFVCLILTGSWEPAIAETVDIIQLDTTTCNYTGGSDGYNGIDGNWSTVHSASYDGGDGGGGCSVVSEHTFARPYDIDSIKYRLEAYSYDRGSYSRNRNYSVSVETKDKNGTWTTMPGTSSSGYDGGDGALHYNSGEAELTGLNIYDVIAIRISANAGSSAAGGNGRFWGHAYIYEIQAYGVHYDDIGIRIKANTSTIKLGVEPLKQAQHKLRIRKNNITYGIPLVDVTDRNASPIRIYDGITTKALPKLE